MNAELIICNRTYKLECDEQQHEDLKKAANLLNSRLSEIRASHPYLENERLAVLAALEICQELLQLQNQQDDTAQARKTLSRLSEEVARVLSPTLPE